jgi:hypothetical protein
VQYLFAIGNLSFGLALARGRGLTRVVGYFLIAAAALTLTIISAELKGPALPETLSYWAYPAIQPLGRMLIGLWLWRAANESEPLP